MPFPPDASPDPKAYERFVQLLVQHEPALRAFVRSLVPRWEDVDDVMQESTLVAWRKFSQFQEGSSFLAWAGAIARFESLKQLRKQSRDRLIFSDEVLDLVAQEGLEEAAVFERERHALEDCLGQLETPQRDLLRASYEPGVRLHEAAARVGKSVQAFYKTIQRLRLALLDCIERRLSEDTP
jgi:RNA polymerase sigma-70 factor (ECF subfamily)